jgi:exopolyphosphatase/guanosine-5'-triphosphate,3'-diphosphate pyrophosphatase
VAKDVEEHDVDWDMVLALRLAALFHRSRADIVLPALQAKRQGRKIRLSLGSAWLARNTLTATALSDEIREWDKIGFELKIPELDELESDNELALAS